jgi:hypothetical protein
MHRAYVSPTRARTKVAQLDGAVGAHEHVLRLHVAVDDAVAVQVVQGVHELLGHVADHVLGERVVVLEHLEQLALRKLCALFFVVR